MPLQAQVPRARSQSLPRVVVRLSLITPIGHLLSFDPGRNVGPGRHQRQRLPRTIVSHHAAGGHPPVDAPRSKVGGLAAVLVLERVVNLQFIPVRGLLRGPRHRPEKDPAVQPRAIRPRLCLEHKIAPGLPGLEKSPAILDVNRLFHHREPAAPPRDYPPPLEIFPIEQRLGGERTQEDVAILGLPGVLLQPNQSAEPRLRAVVGVLQHRLPPQQHLDRPPLALDPILQPPPLARHRRLGLDQTHQAPRGKRGVRIAHVQFVAVAGHLFRFEQRPQKDPAVAPG